MFKKLNFKTLVLIFGGLLAIVVIMQVVKHSSGDRNFKDKLFTVDTAKVSTIILIPRSEKSEIRLVRNGNSWTMAVKGKTYKIERGYVEDMLRILPQMKPERVVATEKSEWPDYQVTDTASVRVKAEQGNKVVADFLVGKFSYTQYKQTTFVRPFDENEVYAIDGFLAMIFNKSANDLRNKSLVNVNQSDITRLTFAYPADSSCILTKIDKIWKINGEKADSAKVANYLSYISNASGDDFVDNLVPSGKPVLSVKIEGKNFNPIEINAFAVDTTHKYILISSINPDSKFSGAKYNLIQKIFLGPKQFKTVSK
jgi:hypothetical protein